jgi:hypothetical protein
MSFKNQDPFIAPGYTSPMLESEKELLAGYHHTISEQLDSRLSESPKFFGLLVVVSTGYGYVLSKDNLSNQRFFVVIVSLVSYLAVLWASCYLAALGYAFRFLQNTQHCIEFKLGWQPYTPGLEDGRRTGQPPQPWPGEGQFWDNFWLLPGTYHAHAFGLAIFLAIIVVAYGWHALQFGQSYGPQRVTLTICVAAIGLGWCWICWINRHYLLRFRTKRNNMADGIKSVVGAASTDSASEVTYQPANLCASASYATEASRPVSSLRSWSWSPWSLAVMVSGVAVVAGLLGHNQHTEGPG